MCLNNYLSFLALPNDKLWEESLNSDGHQFHQYQQNE